MASALPPVAVEAARWASHVVRVAFPDVSGEGDIVPPEVVPGRDVGGLLVLGVSVVFLVEVNVLVIEIFVEVKVVLGKQTVPLRAPVAPDG